MNNLTIRLEKPEDWREVEHLTREAFWNVYRPGCTEHFVLHRYRSNPDFIPELDFGNSYIEINIVSNNCSSKSFVRKYVRRDNHGVRGKPYSNLKLDEPSENKVSCYLKNKKKR